MIKIVDTETTSLNGSVVEVAAITINEKFEVLDVDNDLVDPQEGISPSAMGVHHITYEMVQGKPTFDELLTKYQPNEGDYFIAHNAPFDKKILESSGVNFEGVKVIDTLALVKELLDKRFGDNKLGTVFYGYGCHQTIEYEGDAHRAAYDCFMLLEVLKRISIEFNLTLDDMYELCKPKHISEQKCHLKKYKGVLWKDVKATDPSYCDWVINNFDPEKDSDLIAYLKE